MLKVIGAALILFAGVHTSYKLTAELKDKVEVISALADLTDHIGRCIYTERLPQSDIFRSFSSKALEKYGFIIQLNRNGLISALETVKKLIPQNTEQAITTLAIRLGGINTDTQIKLCNETSKLLREEYNKQKNSYLDKRKMYRSLPILLAASIIIMTL